jgi:Divergent InlB B-repeat domain
VGALVPAGASVVPYNPAVVRGRRGIAIVLVGAMVSAGGWSAAAGTASASPGHLKILVLYNLSTSTPGVLKSALEGNAYVSTVDSLNAGEGGSTPTVAQLQGYDLVFVDEFSSAWLDGTTLGNNMASYVQTGGVVVLSNFFWLYNGIGGQFTDTSGYSPYQHSSTFVAGTTELGAYDASSPLMQGISTLHSSSPRYELVLAPGATQVAATNDVTPLPLVAVKGNVVGINASLNDADPWAGDWPRLIVNAGNALGHPQPTISVARAGNGSGTVTSSPAGINCGSTCAAQFLFGSIVTLTATPATGSTFAGWTGGGCSGTATCTVTMSSSPTVIASFVLSGGGGAGATGGAKPGTASLRHNTAMVVNGNAQVTLKCNSAGPCSGRDEIDATGAQASRKHKRKKFAVVGRGSYSLAAGQTATIKIPLTAKGKHLLKKHRGKLHTTLTLAPSSGTRASSPLTLKLAKPTKKKH